MDDRSFAATNSGCWATFHAALPPDSGEQRLKRTPGPSKKGCLIYMVPLQGVNSPFVRGFSWHPLEGAGIEV